MANIQSLKEQNVGEGEENMGEDRLNFEFNFSNVHC